MPIVDAFPLPPTVRARTVPTSGSRAFGAPRGRGTRSHAGVDLFAPAGTPVISPVDGRVVATHDDAERNCGFGLSIRSTDGLLWTLCHFRAMPLPERGELVEAGDVVGHVGSTGNAEGGAPHLHLHALDRDGAAVNVTAELVDALRRERGASPAPRPAAPPRTSQNDRTSVGAGVAMLAIVGLVGSSMARARKGR